MQSTLFLSWLIGNQFNHSGIITSLYHYSFYTVFLFPLFPFFLPGVCLGVEVYQTPRVLLRRPDEKVQLVCNHEKTDYTVMQWYQKSPGDRALKRIGHVYYSNIEHEEAFKEHFTIIGDMSGETAKNGSLFIADLKAPEHSAVYYCAASFAH